MSQVEDVQRHRNLLQSNHSDWIKLVVSEVNSGGQISGHGCGLSLNNIMTEWVVILGTAERLQCHPWQSLHLPNELAKYCLAL